MKNIKKEFAKDFDGVRLLRPITLKSNTDYILDSDIVVDFVQKFPTREEIEEDPFLRYGFFAAIIICGSNISLQMNGHEIKMSNELNKELRFFSLIELNNSPFPLRDGLPTCNADKKTCSWKSGKNICIRNGTFGLSSHSSIHGNNNWNVTIKNVKMNNFEVGGLMLNGFHNLRVSNLTCHSNFQNILFNGKWSSLIQHWHQGNSVFSDKLKQYTAVLKELIEKNLEMETPMELFENKKRIIEGTIYGILLNRSGVAVSSHGTEQLKSTPLSENAILRNITIRDITGGTQESLAISYDGRILRDISGHFIDLIHVLETGTMDVLTFHQLLYASLLQETEINSTLFVPREILKWYNEIFENDNFDWKSISKGELLIHLEEEELDALSQIIENGKIMRGGDGMFHVNKGVMALKLDGVKDVKIENVLVKNVANNGELLRKFENDNITFLESNTEHVKHYSGNFCYGILVNQVNTIKMEGLEFHSIFSKWSKAFGLLLMNKTENVSIEKIKDDNEEKSRKIIPNSDYCSIIVQSSCKNFMLKD